MPILDAARRFIHGLRAYLERQGVVPAPDSAGFLADLFERFPFATEARTWLSENVHVEVTDLSSTGGGGGYHVGRRIVRLGSAQYEAAIHELAHALWEDQRRDRPVRDGLVAAVQQLAEDPDPRWSRVRGLAQHYVFGIPTQPGFEHGLLLPRHKRGTGGGPEGEWNDWEMFAGLASGCMADIRLLPPYVRQYYLRLFRELPPGAPRPASRAPHR